jgi:hypothetical protein
MDVDKALEILKWPFVIVICVLGSLIIFQNSIATLITRTKRAAYGDKSIDFVDDQPKAAAEQQKKLEAPSAEVAMVPATHALPPSSEIHAPIEQEIRTAMANANLPADVEKAWLIRAVAGWRIARAHEVVYRLIVGSQITILLQANTASPPNLNSVREIYDTAKATFPDMYTSFIFETWIHFPVSMGLLRMEPAGTDPAILKITPLGQDFLHYLINNSLTAPKYG